MQGQHAQGSRRQTAGVSTFVLSLTARAWICGAALLAVTAALIVWQTAAQPDWAEDGYTYSIRMQMDRGVTYETARANSRTWFADKQPMTDPRFRKYANAPYPEYWELFSIRTLYPWLAAQLPQSLGMRALLVVSNAAYVAFAGALFLICLMYVVPEAAALVTLCVALLPIVRLYGSASLTDMLAAALWGFTLLFMCRFIATRHAGWITAYAAAAALMTLARPIPYIPLCSAAALLVWALAARDRSLAAASYELGGIALLLCGAVAVMSANAHAPSFVWILQHLRAGSRLAVHASLWQWYLVRVTAVAGGTIVALFAAAAAPLGFAFLFLRRKQPETALYVGAIGSTLLTIALNPVFSDIERVIVLPLLPVAAAGLAIGTAAALQRSS